MELRQVQTFRAVAEELSFSRAAAKLGYVQSSVSAQVGALERELGVPLFDRLGRRIRLTDAGEVMLANSRKLLALAEETKQAVVDAGVGSGEVTGSLTVSAPETLITYRLPLYRRICTVRRCCYQRHRSRGVHTGDSSSVSSARPACCLRRRWSSRA